MRRRFSAHEYLLRGRRAGAWLPMPAIACAIMSENDAPIPGGPPLDVTEESYRDLRRQGQDPKEGAGRTDPDQTPGRDSEEPPRDKS